MSSIPDQGASVEALASHYDLGNAFFGLWLDPTMTYTCALWGAASPGESLETAQRRKIDVLLDAADAPSATRLLDIGCGWGGLLRHAVARHPGLEAVGLTLGERQAAWSREHATPGVEVRVESWTAHAPERPYDAITSVEAFEAFARLGLSSEAKIAVYRSFFEQCHRWLVPGGQLAMQTITYGNAGPEDFDEFIASEIFPESDLPRLAEIATAIERRFEVVAIHNRRHDYARTLRAWLAALKARRGEAVAEVGEEVVVRFERYLRLSTYMFEKGTCDLLQLTLRRIDQPRPSAASPGGHHG